MDSSTALQTLWIAFPKHHGVGLCICTGHAGLSFTASHSLLVYLDDPDVLQIVAVAHSKRKPGYWKHRL
jgi:hypothetical protein